MKMHHYFAEENSVRFIASFNGISDFDSDDNLQQSPMIYTD